MKKHNLFLLSTTLILSTALTSCTNHNQSNASEQTTVAKDTTNTVKVPVAEPKVSPKTALGIDVSHFQGEVDWEEIKANNISFAYSKATQGISYVDSKFHENWKNMAAANLARGAYHFYMAADDGATQAQHFIKTVGELQAGDLHPVLDLEQGGISGTVEVNEFQKEVQIWLNAVEKKFGVKPIIYTNNPFANEYWQCRSRHYTGALAQFANKVIPCSNEF